MKSILTGRGDGSFAPYRLFAVNLQPLTVRLADFDGDGHLDVLSCGPYGSISMLPGLPP